MDLGLSGKKAVVTGGSRGIGRAVALALAGEGADVAVAATTEERAAGTASACRELGVRAVPYGVDIADSQAVQDWAGRVLETFGPPDVLVNNAGITRDNLLLRMSEQEWDDVMAVNLKGAFNTVKAFSRPLLKNRGARVVNVASVVGLGGNPGQSNYAASKAGLMAFTRSLAREFAGRGVLVNAVAPGLVETDMTRDIPEAERRAMEQAIPLGRAGAPAEVAACVLFLASSLSEYVTGQVLVVDGGMRT